MSVDYCDYKISAHSRIVKNSGQVNGTVHLGVHLH